MCSPDVSVCLQASGRVPKRPSGKKHVGALARLGKRCRRQRSVHPFSGAPERRAEGGKLPDDPTQISALQAWLCIFDLKADQSIDLYPLYFGLGGSVVFSLGLMLIRSKNREAGFLGGGLSVIPSTGHVGSRRFPEPNYKRSGPDPLQVAIRREV